MAGLIGPDGVGKSTLLALAAGARRMQEGDVHVLGGGIRDRHPLRACNHRIAYLPQGLGRNLYPTLTVSKNRDFFGRLCAQPAAERERRITELLRATGLDPFPDRPVGKLSAGMKQKLSLCSALIHDPDLLILDEPTNGVDPLSRQQFWDRIDPVRTDRPDMSVIVATAYMEEAERFDWLATMGIVREKETSSIANFSSSPVTRAEFAIDKQLPCVVIASARFLRLLAISYGVFQVPTKGSAAAVLVGTLIYVLATTGFGFLVSTFTRTQVAETFATAIIAIIPAVNFSGRFCRCGWWFRVFWPCLSPGPSHFSSRGRVFIFCRSRAWACCRRPLRR